MRIKNDGTMPVLLYTLFMIALTIYLRGFFPVENTFQYDKIEPLKRGIGDGEYKSNDKFQKLVLLVIDALRYDFVFPTRTDRYMPFTTSSITDKKSCLVKLKAQSPTVTMPRLKAMTSGIVPTYFDVVANFMSNEFKADSFIQQALLNNMKIVFYGDDTWLKLFPNVFIRSEGTNSFFASDYTEVDDNVTRHLDEEFKKRDWDFLILHYLGLDHIGHMEGPKSSLVQPKLEEMDSVIFKIFQFLQKMEEEGMKTLFIVTSDHGMKDSGGHGGVTEPEVTLPLVSVGKPCHHIPGWPVDYIAEQIDLALTITTAFGLPLPGDNVGKIIPSLLYKMNVERILQVLELNAVQLRLRAGLPHGGGSVGDPKQNDSRERLREKVRRYFDELSYLSSKLRSVSEFNITYLFISISIMWIILIMMIMKTIRQYSRPRRVTQFFLLLGIFLHGLSFSSTSMIEEEHQTWYFLWVTLCILIVKDTLGRTEFSILQNIKSATPWIAILIAHRILRKLNQTGDKWAMLPDLKSFFNSPENNSYLTWLYITGLTALIWFAARERCNSYQLILFTFSVLINVCYRLSVSAVHLPLLYIYPKSRGSFECTLFWCLVVVLAVQTKKPSLVWSLVASILVKPHNVILIPVALFVNQQINNLYQEPSDILWNCIAHFWCGFLFYFYQGNSNSIANIDVSAGFTGLDKYNSVYSFMMIAFHTNFSHILAYSSSPLSHITFSVLSLAPITFYCTLLSFQLNHLFIWSVFSPKLLYETNFAIVYLLLLWFDYLCSFCPDVLHFIKKRVISRQLLNIYRVQ